MAENSRKRILIAGTNSGCGKTTVTLALLAALKKRGEALSSFKCGPDYIDPMFHRAVLGVPCCNLDPFFCTEEQLCGVFLRHAADVSVIEGVMGYYDGIGTEGSASTFSVAKATETPVVLVVNVRGMYTSAGAVIKGFREFRPGSGIKGVLFNGASPMLYKDLAKIAEDAGVRAYGYMPRVPEAEIGSRHLGLITAAEIEDLQAKLAALGEKASECLDIEGLLELAGTAPELGCPGGLFGAELGDTAGAAAWSGATAGPAASGGRLRLAVAKDEAFCFIYTENLELLQEAGFDIVCFSPLRDECVPADADALYLPGGYPELYTEQLSSNNRMLNSIKLAINSGLPTFAECGGFMYLHDTLDGWPMAGVISGACNKTDRLQRFGYITITAKQDNMFCRAGESIRAHEFHYYDSEDPGSGFRAEKPSGKRGWDCVHASETLYAGYPHLYLPANPRFAKSFAQKAAGYSKRKTQGGASARKEGTR